MIGQDINTSTPKDRWEDRFPRLARLRLSEADFTALQRQGFVSTERLPSGSPCHKLRFRGDDGKQHVRYIGIDEEAKAKVEQELEELQADRRLDRELLRLTRDARALLREVKRRLTPELAGARVKFHGNELRQTRRSSSGNTERERIVSGAVEAHKPLTKEDVNDEYGHSTESGLLFEERGPDRTQDAENSGVPDKSTFKYRSSLCQPRRRGRQFDADGTSPRGGDRGVIGQVEGCVAGSERTVSRHGDLLEDHEAMGSAIASGQSYCRQREAQPASTILKEHVRVEKRRNALSIPAPIIPVGRAPPLV